MKRSKISLDFTSLLDIMMIILFFFILNFKSSVDSVQANAAKIQAEANEEKATYELKEKQLKEDKQKFEEEKEEWQKQVDAELKKIREVDRNAAANAEALLNFQKGIFWEMELKINNKNDWSISIKNGSINMGEITSQNSQNICNEIISILENNGFGKDDVIIAIFIYNLHDNGSGFIPEYFLPQIRDINNIYVNFYCAEIRK